MFRRSTVIVAGIALAVAGAAAVAAPARAAVPLDPSSARSFTVVCSTGEHASITLPVAGSSVPGSIAGGSSLLVPYRFDYRWTDARGRVLIRSEAQGEAGPVPRSAITCRFGRTAYPDGTFLSFTVVAVVRHVD